MFGKKTEPRDDIADLLASAGAMDDLADDISGTFSEYSPRPTWPRVVELIRNRADSLRLAARSEIGTADG